MYIGVDRGLYALFQALLLFVNCFEHLVATLYRWLGKLAAATHLLHNLRLLELSFETLQRLIDTFVVAYFNNQHKMVLFLSLVKVFKAPGSTAVRLGTQR